MATFTLTQAVPHAKKYYVYPNGDISGCKEWVATSSPDFECVDDDKDTINFDDYIRWQDASTGTEIFNFEDFSPPAGTVNFVKLYGWAKCYPDSVESVEEFHLVTSPNASCADIHKSDAKNLVTGWSRHSYSWTENPNTVAAWTVAQINSAAFGVEGKGLDIGLDLLDIDNQGGSYKDVYVCREVGNRICTVNGTHLIVYYIDANDDYQVLGSVACANSTGVWAEKIRQTITPNEMYIYVACGVDGLRLYHCSNGGVLTLLDTLDNGGDYKKVHGWAYNNTHFVAEGVDTSYTRIFVAVGANGVYAYSTINNDYSAPGATRLALHDTINDGGGEIYEDVYVEDWDILNYTPLNVHCTCDDTALGTSHVRAYEWNIGVGFIARGTSNIFAYLRGIWAREAVNTAYDAEVFVACRGGGVAVYGYDDAANTYTYIDSIDDGGDYLGVNGGDSYIYCAVAAWGIRVYSYLRDTFRLVENVDDGYGYDLDVFNGYVHLANAGVGIALYDIANTQELYLASTYLEIDYTSDTTTCNLNRPQQISTNHARNIKMINFWNGDREVYDLNRSGKSMVLTGSERGTTACDTIICVRDMARNGAIVTIGTLAPTYFNGDYRIRSFGWNKISEKPEHYKWILYLESAN